MQESEEQNSADKEREILRLIKIGDSSWMEVLYRAYAGYLTGVCTRYLSSGQDARDVLHDSFLRIFSSISTFEYRGRGSMKAWLTRIVVNESIKIIRKECRSETLCSDDIVSEFPEEGLPEISGLPMEVLHEMIRSLPVGYRTVFNLYVMEEKNHKEIAQILDIKEASSASQLHRAKALLAQRITKYLAIHGR